MNIKIAKTMLALCIIYIVGFYILKFIFPDTLLLVVTDPTILKFGQFVESWKGYTHIIQTLSTFLTLYLFTSASRWCFKLKWYHALYLLGGTVITNLILYLLPELYTHVSISIMLLLAMLMKGKLSYTAITFSIHGLLSQFLFSIRGFETIVMKYNMASGLALAIECYVWLVLLALLFYLKEKKNGRISTTIPKQNG